MTYLLFIIYLSKSDFDDISIEETWPFSDDNKSLFIGYLNADIKLILISDNNIKNIKCDFFTIIKYLFNKNLLLNLYIIYIYIYIYKYNIDMENEKNEIKKEKNEFDYIKNLCYDTDSGKITINDSENNIYKSDIFGRKIPKFLPHITGLKNRYNKNELEQKNLFRQKRVLNLKSISTNESLGNNTNINISRNKKGYINYTPVIRKFEGYSKFPRPRGPPLLNIPDYELKETHKRKIIEQLNNYYSQDCSAKNDIKRKNENKGLSYLTKNLNEFDTIKYDINKLQKLVKNNLDEIKLKYHMKENLYKKDNIVKALSQFNRNISENKNSKTINGRILQEPDYIMKKYYKIINKAIKHKKNLTHEKYNFKNNLKKFNLNLISENITNKNITKDINEYAQTEMKDFTMGKIIKLDFGNSPEIKKEQIESELKDNNDENKNEEINIEVNDTTNNEINENINNENNEENNNENNEEKNEEKNEEEKSENNNNNILEEKIKNNDISFLSELSENSKKYFKKNNLTIKTINRINTNAEHDNKLLEGYIEKPVEDIKIFQKSKVLRLKTEGDLYLDNLSLLKKTNKTAFLLQEKKDLYDLKLLKKKIQNQTININNAMRIKKIPNRKKEIINTE